MTEQEMHRLVEMLVDELEKRGHLSREVDEQTAVARIKAHYAGQKSEAVRRAEADPYGDVLYLYYVARETVEAIAESLGCDRSTVTRNKKRLINQIRKEMQNGGQN